MILVVGAGFLGTKLITSLIDKGHEVTVVSKSPVSVNGAKCYVADISDADQMAQLNDKFIDVEKVFFMATRTPYSTEPYDNINDMIKTNIVGIFNFIKLSKSMKKLKSIVYASTVDVYGSSDKLPITESSSTRPKSYYAKTKLAGELALRECFEQTNISVVVLRFTQLYGPEDNSNKLVPSILKNMIAGSSLKIYGNGSDLRDLLYIDDAVNSLMKCLEYNKSAIFNVATGSSCNISEIVSFARDNFSIETKVENFDRKKEKMDFVFNTDFLNDELKFNPSVNMNDGIAKTLSWMKINES